MPELAAFIAGLQAEVATFGELCQVLESEQSCLLRSDADALLGLTELKSRQVERLGTLAGARTRYLHSLRLPADHAGMARLLESEHGRATRELGEAWRKLVALAEQARALNETNGGLIATRLNHNRAALDALVSAARTLSTYGPDGHTDLPTGQRELGRA
jgi:flagella synthesis protein FlgN